MDKKTKAKKTIPDTICRVHRSGGYAVLSNCFVRSTNIGCDSIGLLGKINDLPPTWNFTIVYLKTGYFNPNPEKQDADPETA